MRGMRRFAVTLFLLVLLVAGCGGATATVRQC
jgi:hypothetical protein